MADDLRALLDALIEPLGVGDAVAPGWTIEALSTELGARIVLRAGAATMTVELAPHADGRRYAVATRHVAISYRAASGGQRVDEGTGLALCQAIAARVSANEEAVVGAAGNPGSDDAPRVREVSVERLLELRGSAAVPYVGLSPYVGCLIGCRFCYAQSRLEGARRFVGLPQVPWGSWVDARINAPEVLQRELLAGPSPPIKFSPIVSDPYQAIERRFELTRRCLEVIAALPTPPPTLVLTRSALILRDIDRIAAIEQAYVGVSIPTVDDAVRRHFEPRSASIAERLEILRVARARGIATIAVVQPQLPGDASALADALAGLVDSARVDVLTGEEGAAADFDVPAVRHARQPTWQAERAERLATALAERGVARWTGELPPELCP